MAYAPTLLDDVARALEEFPEGISVKALAEDMDHPEMNVRRALDNLFRSKKVIRRKGEPMEGGNKPPYLYSLVPDKEPEVPRMPSINDVPPEDDTFPGDPASNDDQGQPGQDPGQDPGQEQGDDQGGGEAQGGQEAPPAGRDEPVGRYPSRGGHRPPRKPAQAALDTMNRREVTEAEADQAARANHKVGGTRRIERVDPMAPGFPAEEKGMLGRVIELSTLNCPLEEYIARQYGGGSFLVHPCGNDGQAYGGRVIQYDISGPPIPVTAAGRAWRRKYDARVEADAGETQGGKVPDFMTMMEMFDRKARESRQESQQQFQQTLQLLSPQKAGEAQSLETLRSAHRDEMEKTRLAADKRVDDLKAAHALIVKKYDDDIRALRDDLRNLDTKLTNAWTKEKSELQVTHLAKVAEVREAHQKELQALKDQAAKDLQAVKDQTQKDIAANRKETQQEARIKALEEGPKDIQAEVQKGMIPTIIKIATDNAKKAAGIEEDDDGPETMMDALKLAVVDAGPDVMKRIANGIMTIVEQRQGVRGVPARPGAVARPGAPTRQAAIPQRPGTAPAKPLPALAQPRTAPAATALGGHGLLRERGGPAAPPPPPPVILTEEEQAAALMNPPAQPEVIDVEAVEGPTIEEQLTDRGEEEGVEPEIQPPEAPPNEPALTPAQEATANRLRLFFETLLTEMQIESEATEVWVQPVGDGSITFEDLYYKLPGPMRRAMSEAEPEKAFEVTLAALGVKPQDDPLLQAIQDQLDKTPSAKTWLTEFFEAGPWNEEADEEEEEEGGAPAGASPAP